MNGLALPIQNLAEVVRLPLADRYLQSIAESDKPTLAAEGANFADMADVD